MNQRCSAVIWLDDKHRTSTYCMREDCHPGKHNIKNCEPEEPAKEPDDKQAMESPAS